MQFGVQFFPDVRPEERSAEQYFREALDIAEKADRLGFLHIRIVEHYFHYYAVTARTRLSSSPPPPSAPNARGLSPVRCCRRSTIR
jgi:hypothetical protein